MQNNTSIQYVGAPQMGAYNIYKFVVRFRDDITGKSWTQTIVKSGARATNRLYNEFFDEWTGANADEVAARKALLDSRPEFDWDAVLAR